MCSHFPNNFSRGTVQKFHGTLVCLGTPFENPWIRLLLQGLIVRWYRKSPPFIETDSQYRFHKSPPAGHVLGKVNSAQTPAHFVCLNSCFHPTSQRLCHRLFNSTLFLYPIFFSVCHSSTLIMEAGIFSEKSTIFISQKKTFFLYTIYYVLKILFIIITFFLTPPKFFFVSGFPIKRLFLRILFP